MRLIAWVKQCYDALFQTRIMKKKKMLNGKYKRDIHRVEAIYLFEFRHGHIEDVPHGMVLLS